MQSNILTIQLRITVASSSPRTEAYPSRVAGARARPPLAAAAAALAPAAAALAPAAAAAAALAPAAPATRPPRPAPGLGWSGGGSCPTPTMASSSESSCGTRITLTTRRCTLTSLLTGWLGFARDASRRPRAAPPLRAPISAWASSGSLPPARRQRQRTWSHATQQAQQGSSSASSAAALGDVREGAAEEASDASEAAAEEAGLGARL